jgi:hypothetical protein
MKLFNKFFGLQPKPTTNLSTSPIEFPAQEEIPSDLLKNLFSDNEPPTKTTSSEMKTSRLQDFLKINYSTLGFSDGYESHSTDLLARKISILKSEFRQIIDESIDNRKQEVFQLRNQLIETRGLSDRLVEQLELRIQEIKEVVAKLEREKELSSEDEGLVMNAIHQYHEGFLRGCKDWHEAKLFAQSTGLF